MPRREYTLILRCPVADCMERPTFYVYTTQRDYREASRRYPGHTQLCSRHRKPNEVLDPADNPCVSTTYVSIAKTHYNAVAKEHQLLGLFWVEEQDLLTSDNPHANGFLFGEGFKAWAKDFPEGTRITVTAEAHMPEVQDGIEEESPTETAAGDGGEPTPAAPAAHHDADDDEDEEWFRTAW